MRAIGVAEALEPGPLDVEGAHARLAGALDAAIAIGAFGRQHERRLAGRAVACEAPSRRSRLNSASLSKRSAACGESLSRTASRRQNLRCGHSVCTAPFPAFRLLDCYQAPCCLKMFSRTRPFPSDCVLRERRAAPHVSDPGYHVAYEPSNSASAGLEDSIGPNQSWKRCAGLPKLGRFAKSRGIFAGVSGDEAIGPSRCAQVFNDAGRLIDRQSASHLAAGKSGSNAA